jgi:hypothetical protein
MLRGIAPFLLLIAAATMTTASDDSVASYAGQGRMATRPFTTDGPWEAQFDTTDALFIWLMTPDGVEADLVANQTAGGSGSYYSPRAGTFYLKIDGFGTWKVRIVRVRR